MNLLNAQYVMKQLIDRYPTKHTRLFVRLSPDERQWVVEAAHEANMTISDLVRWGLNQVLPMVEPNGTPPRNIEQYHATYYSTIKEFGRTYKRGNNGRTANDI